MFELTVEYRERHIFYVTLLSVGHMCRYSTNSPPSATILPRQTQNPHISHLLMRDFRSAAKKSQLQWVTQKYSDT